MTGWTTRQLSPFAVYATVLVTLAGLAALTAVLSMRRAAEPEARVGLPFPESQLDVYVLDEIAGHLHRPDLDRRIEWPEHPKGRIVLKTNNLGLREDAPTSISKPSGTFRVLVTGDSHTDGVLDNSESFANRLEQLLNDAAGSPRFEVLNAGTGHYAPQNYLGVLRHYLELEPDHFIVVSYAGNDLLDALAEAWLRGEVEIPERPPDYMERLRAAQVASDAATSQGLNQVLLLTTFPELRQRALDITADSLHEAARICAERGIGFSVVVLPSAGDLPSTTATGISDAAAALDLAPAAVKINRGLAVVLGRALESRGIRVIDPHDAMVSDGAKLYWRRDLHLNVRGHELLAEVFYDLVARQWITASSDLR